MLIAAPVSKKVDKRAAWVVLVVAAAAGLAVVRTMFWIAFQEAHEATPRDSRCRRRPATIQGVGDAPFCAPTGRGRDY
jgi:hypothetical protein